MPDPTILIDGEEKNFVEVVDNALKRIGCSYEVQGEFESTEMEDDQESLTDEQIENKEKIRPAILDGIL